MCYKKTGSLKRWLKGQIMKRMYGMITCVEFEEFMLNYLDGELSPLQTKAFDIHVFACRECRDYLNAYKTTIQMSKLVKETPETPNVDEVPEDLIKAILIAENSPKT